VISCRSVLEHGFISKGGILHLRFFTSSTFTYKRHYRRSILAYHIINSLTADLQEESLSFFNNPQTLCRLACTYHAWYTSSFSVGIASDDDAGLITARKQTALAIPVALPINIVIHMISGCTREFERQSSESTFRFTRSYPFIRPIF
jgi:hypothetical protein